MVRRHEAVKNEIKSDRCSRGRSGKENLDFTGSKLGSQ